MAEARRLDGSANQGAGLGGPGYPLVVRTRDTIDRRRLLEGGETVVVAVSGGADSTCLLDVLTRLSFKLELTLAVAHVDYGLSEGSSEVAARISRDAAEAGHEVHVVRAPDLTGPNLQARARAFRYGFFDTIAARIGASNIATGHTLDDRAETTVARLIHGAGTQGLAGLPPSEGPRIRPLIDSRSRETRGYCVERNLHFHDDAANEDVGYERVAVRKKLLSSIEDHWGEGAVQAIAVSADRLREDSAALAAIGETLFKDMAEKTDQGVRFDMSSFVAVPRAFRRRLLEQSVGRVRDRSGGLEAALHALERPLCEEARF